MPRQFSGEEIVTSTNNAQTTGDLHAKECKRIYNIQKLTQKGSKTTRRSKNYKTLRRKHVDKSL